jgi:DNA-binding transcriptional ArsR family regulator
MERKSPCVRTIYDPLFLKGIQTDLNRKAECIAFYERQLSALANPTRLRIAYILYRYGSLCVCDIAEVLRMNISAISQHLRRMKKSGIVSSRPEGRTIFYELNETCLDLFYPLFLALKQGWKIPNDEKA